jgi:hypothetical protein
VEHHALAAEAVPAGHPGDTGIVTLIVALFDVLLGARHPAIVAIAGGNGRGVVV